MRCGTGGHLVESSTKAITAASYPKEIFGVILVVGNGIIVSLKLASRICARVNMALQLLEFSWMEILRLHIVHDMETICALLVMLDINCREISAFPNLNQNVIMTSILI